VALIGTLASISVSTISTEHHAQATPAPVLVYYYAWWAPQAVGPGKSPDWPLNPYHSWDPAVIQQHVSQIASAGIDGMVVAWYGPQEENNQTETNFRIILDQAAANGITALLSVDLGSAAWFKSTQEVVDGLNYALNIHAQHPAYFRYDGKPVLFFWFQGRYSMSDWASIRQQVDPEHRSIWIAEGAALDALPLFDGLHMYTISWSSNVYATEMQWANSTRNRGGMWVATAMPGWDNTYTQQSERYIRERQDGAFYRETFAAAAASNPSMIVITSWNEWWEGTHIEPSNNYGDFYLNLTAELIHEYQSSGAVASGIGSAPPATIIPPSAGPSQPTATLQTDASNIIPSATARMMPTLPATITPPSLGTITSTVPPALPEMPTQIAEAQDEAFRDGLPASETDDKAEELLPDSTRRLIVGGGLLAGLIGLILIGTAAIAYLHSRTAVDPKS